MGKTKSTPATPRAPRAPRAPKATGDSLTVLDKNGNEVRTYSLADHGENFADLANEFVTKNEARGFKLAE